MPETKILSTNPLSWAPGTRPERVGGGEGRWKGMADCSSSLGGPMKAGTNTKDKLVGLGELGDLRCHRCDGVTQHF